MVAGPHYCFIPGEHSKSRVSDSNFKASEHRVLASRCIIFGPCLDSQQFSSSPNNYSTKINVLYTVDLFFLLLFWSKCFQAPAIFSSYHRLLLLYLTSQKKHMSQIRQKSSFSPSSSQGRAVLCGAPVICSLDGFWKTLHFHFPQSPTVAALPPELLCRSKEGQPGTSFPTLLFWKRGVRAAAFNCSILVFSASFQWYIQAGTVFQRQTWGARLQSSKEYSLL